MTTPAPTRYPFETRPLTDPVDRKAVSAFWRAVRAKHPTPAGQIVMWVVAGAVVLFILVPMVVIVLGVAGSANVGADRLGPIAYLPALFILVIIGIIVFSFIGSRSTRTQRYRIAQFAAANNMTYEDRVLTPALPGMIFQHGSSRMSTALVRGHQPRFVEFANYQYTVKSGKNSTTYRWGYVAVKLDVPLPNIVLDATGNNGLGSNLPASFSRDQRLSLEGDFDQHFTLYCPRGYEQDALYLFTPDIMARFIDHAAELDVEIVDDWMFLYMKRPASTVDPDTWAWLFGTVGALMTKFDQWARWRDERLRAAQAASAAVTPGAPAPVDPSAAAASLPFAPPAGLLAPPPGVAVEGRRLKRGFSWAWIAVLGFAAVWMFINVVFPRLMH